MSTLTVQLGERSYPIQISPGTLKDATCFDSLLSTDKAVIVTNETIAPLYLSALKANPTLANCQVITIPDGEQYKTLEYFDVIIGQLLEANCARDTTLIALGGGVVGDLTGFVAACFQRGIPFIQVPTTLLSQVDSSVGGKTAVNHPLGKNMVGAFYQPKAVIIDTDTLKTLPKREFAAGMAEVIKYGVIYDAELFAWIEDNQTAINALDNDAITHIIHRCCAIKAEIVAQDERESGIRALLNLGHTFGHAIEAEMGYGKWLHGEAVSAGIVLASLVAKEKQWMNASEVGRVIALLKAFDLPVAAPSEMGLDKFMQHMVHDKKVAKGKIRFIIPKGIGHAVVTSEVSESELQKAIEK